MAKVDKLEFNRFDLLIICALLVLILGGTSADR